MTAAQGRGEGVWMRRLAWMLAAALGLAVAPADAAVKYVSPTGSFSWLSASSPATPCRIDTANVRATAGDQVMMAPGTYSTGIAPSNSGTLANRIVFMGAAGDSSSVVVPSITLNGDDYVTVKWMKSTGSLNAASSTNSVGDSVYFCRIQGGVDLSGSVDFTLANCLIGKRGAANTAFIIAQDNAGGADIGAVTYRPIVNDCTAYVKGGSNGDNSYKLAYVISGRFTRFRVFITVTGAVTAPSEFGRVRSCEFTDCRTEMLNTGPTVDAYMRFVRDSTRLNTFLRDTIWQDPASVSACRIEFSASGRTDNNSFSQYGNTYDACVFQNTGLTKGDTYIRRTTWQNCIFILGRGAQHQGTPFFGTSNDSNRFVHNTVYMTTTGIGFDQDTGHKHNAFEFSSNIIVRTADGSLPVVVMNYNTTQGSGSGYNLVYCVAAPQDSALGWNRNGTSGTPLSFSAGRWGDPQFADAAGFNFTPSTSGNAYGAWWPDGYVGAINPGAPSSDVTAPAAISDLVVDGTTSSTISLTWTESGDDGSTGAANRYEVRYSTSAITSGNYSSATIFGSPPTPVWNGQPISVTVTGLNASTTYYFAVKAIDEAGNTGAISNVVSDATTAAPDVTAPATISSLATSLPTTSSIALTWTAPGDDNSTGTATSYAGRYATSAITNTTEWNAATAISGMPTPLVAGTSQSVTVSGLSPSTTYYFAVRATDEASNQAGISNSPSGTTGSLADVTAPAAISDLLAVSATSSAVGLRWTAPGDDGSSGTATSYLVRYSKSGPISNETAWAAATDAASTPTPQVAGSTDEVNVTGLEGGTTYYFSVRAVDEANNTGALSNTPNRTTLPDADVVRPAQPSITAMAWPGKADGALVVFSAVGDDSLTGAASSYQVRYRIDTAPTATTWEDAGVQSRTYRVSTSQSPKSSGLADTVYVRGLRPGATYYFAVRALDDEQNPSAISSGDSVAIPARLVSQIAQPAPFIYAGANSASPPNWYPYVSADGSSIDTVACRDASRFVGIAINPTFAESVATAGAAPYGRRLSLRALQIIKSMNPAFLILGEPPGDAAYYRNDPDSTSGFNLYAQMWRAVRIAGGGWTSGSGAPGGGWTPGGYSDSTGTAGFLWTNVPGYRGWFYQTYNYGRVQGAAYAGIAGLTNWNVNLARRAVADSVADVCVRHYVLRKHPDGTYVYDGIRWDLFSQDPTATALAYEDVDYVRAGFASKVAFDSAWIENSDRLVARVRQAAVDAGRPDFVLCGNGGNGLAVDHMNGWMNEYFPNQQGGTWFTNMFKARGGMVADRARMAWSPYTGTTFTFLCDGYVCTVSADSVGSRRMLRYGLGSAALAQGLHAFGPEYASGAKDTLQRMWADEYAVDTLSSQARATHQGTGWLGHPTTDIYQSVPAIYSGGDRLLGNGGFEYASVTDAWTATTSGGAGQANISLVTDTVATGSKAVRLRVGTVQSSDWRVALTSLQKGYATSGQTVVLTFRARASFPRWLQAMAVNSGSAVAVNWASGSASDTRSWITTGWQTYRIVGTATGTDSLRAAFWAGDTTGTIWLDDVTLHIGGSRGGSYIREYRRGVVVVNPQTYADTITFGRAVRRITTLPGKNPDVNSGELIAAGQPIIVPPTDARFLIFPVDSLRPSRVTSLVATSAYTDRAFLAWTAPGNDSTSGTATSYQVRIAPSAITDESAWSAATPVSMPASPQAAGAAEALTVSGLSPSTTYYFALRAYDGAGYVGAISNSDSTRTLPVGSAPTAAFALNAYSGAEPLSLTCTDQTSGSPSSWEWVVERVRDGADTQISDLQNPTFVLSDSGTYYVRLQVLNGFGTDTTLALVTVSCTPPEQVTSLEGFQVSTTQVLLKWLEPGDDGATGSAHSFDVRYAKGSVLSEATWAAATQVTSGVPTPTYGGQSTSMTVNGLTVGETYTFGMKARDSNGCWNALSNVVTVTTPGAIERTVSVPFGSVEVKITVERKR